MAQTFDKENIVTEEFAADPLSWRYESKNGKQFIATYFKEREINGSVTLELDDGNIKVEYTTI